MRVLCGTSQFTILIVHCSIECGLVARCSSERMSGHVPVRFTGSARAFGAVRAVRRSRFGLIFFFFCVLDIYGFIYLNQLLHFGHLHGFIYNILLK